MRKLHLGIILILMMLGHNYVINQPQSLQPQLQQIHEISVTQFNTLYSIPSILALLTIIPIGILYHKYPNFTLMFGVAVLFIGQLLVVLFGSEGENGYFGALIAGRTLQGAGAEVLYMIQGNLASSCVGNMAGVVFILPQIGQIMNAFFTPYLAIQWGVKVSLCIGLFFCGISMVACWILYCHLKKIQKIKADAAKVQMFDKISQNKHSSESIGDYTTASQEQDNSSQGYNEKHRSKNKFSKKDISLKHKHLASSQDEQNELSIKKQSPMQPKSILEASGVFWLTILICAINQCLYFPFLDNANQLIQMRFLIPYQDTGLYLCLPFIAAIITTLIMSKVLQYFERRNIIVWVSLLPLLGHGVIYLVPNAQGQIVAFGWRAILALGFFLFGMGIGGYYSVSFPAVGLSVPQSIRGLGYGVLCFFQTLAMSLIPMLSGLIIQEDVQDQISGYKNNSLMFVLLTLMGTCVAFLIRHFANALSFMYDDQEPSSQQSLQLIDVPKNKISMSDKVDEQRQAKQNKIKITHLQRIQPK